MAVCRHVTQYDGSPCANYNCAAASAAMLIDLGTGGRVRLTAALVRNASGRSCTPMDPPDATHSRSGGLYITDVQKVADLHDVSIDYHGGESWPPGTLRRLLTDGYAAVILGDCRYAPVSPSSNVIYHSAVVHDYDVVHDTTHWHDPRLGSGVWVPVAAVEKYQLGFHGQRLAGFVRDYISHPEPAPAPVPEPAPLPPPPPVVVAPPPEPEPEPVLEISDDDRALLEKVGLIKDGRLLTREEIVARFSVSPKDVPDEVL